jgi:replicative DNA helicase
VAENENLPSEGEELVRFLAELARDQTVSEISGWHSGFRNLDRALDGFLPGVYLYVGRPASGRTSFARQLLDEVVQRNRIPGVFFSFSDAAKELRLKALSRLTGIETRELRRGSGYLLHWYGMPKRVDALEDLPPSWEKVQSVVEAARPWLDLVHLVECGRNTSLAALEDKLRRIIKRHVRSGAIVVIDDSHRLALSGDFPDRRLTHIVDEMKELARNANAAVLAVWPDLSGSGAMDPRAWVDQAPGADVVIVAERDRGRQPLDPNQEAVVLNIVKNRGGERGKLAFDFSPALSRFEEVT